MIAAQRFPLEYLRKRDSLLVQEKFRDLRSLAFHHLHRFVARFFMYCNYAHIMQNTPS